MSQPAGRPDRPARRARRASSGIDVPEPGGDPCQCCDSTRDQGAGMRTIENVGTGNQGDTFAAFLGVVSSPLARDITPPNDDLAPELGLSRSRFSRLVTAGGR